MKWEKVKLGSVAKVISGFAFKSEDFKPENGIPVIKIKNIQREKIEFNETSYLPIEFLSVDPKFQVIKNDILISLTGSHITLPNSVVGRVAKYSYYFVSLLNQRAGKIIPKSNAEIDNEFLYQYLTLNDVRREIALFGHGGANQCNISPGNVESIEVPLPPLPTQQKIASILSAYDDLIENNLKRIRLLEEAAQRLYQEWFVRFRFPGWGEVRFLEGLPEGWERKRADNVFEISIGKTPPRKESQWFEDGVSGIKWVSIRDMNASSAFIFETSESITSEGVNKFNMNIAPSGTVILSFKLSIGAVAIVTEDMVTNEAIAHFKIQNTEKMSSFFTYCYLKNFNFDTLGSTSSIGTAINSKIVKSLPFLVPEIKVAQQFEKVITPVFCQIKNLLRQNQKLKEARDILLPRLMSGVLKV